VFHGSTAVAGEPLVLTFDSPRDMIVDAGSLAGARTLVRTTTVDIAMVDLTVPDGNGFELIPEICGAHPHASVVVLTVSTDRADLDQAHAMGVRLLPEGAALAQLRGLIQDLSA
jgi:DNA-binding NarL/FixJ family response regulator